MLEKNDFMVLDEDRAAVILLRVLLEKGRINQKTFDKVVKNICQKVKGGSIIKNGKDKRA